MSSLAAYCLVAGLGLSLLGCQCDRRRTRPYTPFGIATEQPRTVPSPEPSGSAPVVSAEKAHVLSAPSHEITFEGAQLNAPPNSLIKQILKIQATTGPAFVAWIQPSDGPDRAAGELWELGTQPRRLATVPAFVPNHPRCTHELKLQGIGPGTVALQTAADCGSLRLAPHAPIGALQILSLDRRDPELLVLRLSAPAGDADIDIASRAPDLDEDGHSDLSVTWTLTRPDIPGSAATSIQWLSKAAGLARDFDTPKTGFLALARSLVARSKRDEGRDRVLRQVENARRLFHFLCGEAGRAAVTDAEGQALECGSNDAFNKLLLEAEVRASLGTNQLDRALAALLRADWMPWSARSAAADAQQELIRVVLQSATVVDAKRRSLDVTPLLPGPAPQLGPLAFDARGRLLVLTSSGVVRFSGAVAHDASAEHDPWALVPEGPEHQQIATLQFPCDQPTISIHARQADGRLSEVLDTTWLAPRPGPCQGAADFTAPELRLVAWGGTTPRLILGTQEFGAAPGNTPGFGSPYSPNGTKYAAATPWGVFVKGLDGQSLWRTDVVGLTFCTVDDSGTQVGCLDGERATLLFRQSDGHGSNASGSSALE